MARGRWPSQAFGSSIEPLASTSATRTCSSQAPALLAWAAGVGRTLRPAAGIVLGSFAFFLGTLTMTLAYNHTLRSDLSGSTGLHS